MTIRDKNDINVIRAGLLYWAHQQQITVAKDAILAGVRLIDELEKVAGFDAKIGEVGVSEPDYCKDWLIRLAKNYGGKSDAHDLRSAVTRIDHLLADMWQQIVDADNARRIFARFLSGKP